MTAVPTARIASYRALLVIVCALTCVSSPIKAASSVSQYGITWTFSQDRTVGQFVNGDWYVVGPVTITSITPAPVELGYAINGSQINPIPNQPQGLYHDRTQNSVPYDAAKNVALNLPATIQPGNSLYSTVMNPNTWGTGSEVEKTWFKETAVLTILGAAPPAGSFRPPYAGANKTIKSNWNVSRLNYGALRSLAAPVPANVPNRVWMENATQRPLLEMHYNYLNSQWKSSWAESKAGGYPRRTYGREISHISSGAGLFLQTNVSNATKERLLINMCQWGIDIHGLINNGMQWQSNGGHNLGRVMPLYIAAKVLGDGEMLAQANPSKGPFQEFQNHYFILQSDIDRPRSIPNAKPYTQAMLGMPEWSSDGRSQQERASSDFWDSGYRFINGAPNCAVIATIALMGGRAELNHEAFYRYITERYYPLKKSSASDVLPNYNDNIMLFTRDMWDVYLAGGTIPPIEPSTPPSKVLGLKVVK